MAETEMSVISNVATALDKELTQLNRVASAVALPEDSGEQSPIAENGLKRRHSEASEQESKRQRTSPGKNSPTATPKDEEVQEQPQEKAQPEQDDLAVKPAQKAPDTREPRRKSGVPDEKQRSKRLFGALLGNLNQPGDRVSRRRSEIEQRRKAELQKQDDERLEDRQKRLEKLGVQRRREQINVDEQNMHMRHKNLLKTANFLQTKAEPRLYYKPWELRTDEEDRIDDQIKDTEDQIDKELADWEEEKQKRLDALDDSGGDSANKPSDSNPSNEPIQDETTQEGTHKDAAAPSQGPLGDQADKEMQEEASTNQAEKGAEVPESDQGEHINGDGPEQASKDVDEPKQEEEAKTEDTHAGDPIEEEKKDDNDDDGDHVVEGDEDDVIY
ncbi:hypothetical protein PRZ48_006310 [Zasmidium cellare]|uniref:Pinin/SDK/MemA protein domain-containing protein n=1 Tax=Zasmidium cellare TaxID=395010 RepID=A0ABR0EMT1_ZASCE|nr:hypothetical protein PRZ48_006310 [Zasmidium cellare]